MSNNFKRPLAITEQPTEVHTAFPPTPPFKPLPAYTKQQAMRFGKKTLFSLLLGFDLLANMLELTHVNFLYTTTLISFCTYILLPGFLISLILRIRKLSFWENLLFIVGLSIAFLEFGGLLLNILLPLFGVENPLAFQNIVFGFDIYILLLFIFAWIRTKPVLATLGAIVLNNGGSNILTLILLGAIAVYSLLLVLFRDKIAVDLYPYAIFFIGIASLFTTSLRSWYISGHDIEIEFYVFQLTNTHHIWNMAFFQDTYNACLSITILPTILTNLLAIPDMYVYKVIFQILFATSPVLVFFIVRNYTTPVFAFLSAFLFMSFPTFFSDMPMLNRQEIGFIFFGLALYMMLERNRTQQFSTKSGILPLSELSFSMRRILFIIFALSVIVSHYSTNFVLLGLIAFVYVLTLIISRSFMKNTFALSMRRILLIVFALSVIFSHDSTNFVLLGLIAFVYVLTFIISRPFMKNTFASLLSKTHITLKNTFPNKMFLNLPLILILFVMTYFWNTFYTHSSNNAGSVVLEVANSMLIPSSTDARSSDLSNSIFFAHHSDPKQELQDYINRIRQSAESQNTGEILASKFYSKSIISKYPINPISQEQLAPTPLGNLLSSASRPYNYTACSISRVWSTANVPATSFYALPANCARL